MEKKLIKIKLSDKAINEILDMEEELGLEIPETREARRKLKSKEMECLFG